MTNNKYSFDQRPKKSKRSKWIIIIFLISFIVCASAAWKVVQRIKEDKNTQTENPINNISDITTPKTLNTVSFYTTENNESRVPSTFISKMVTKKSPIIKTSTDNSTYKMDEILAKIPDYMKVYFGDFNNGIFKSWLTTKKPSSKTVTESESVSPKDSSK